MRCLVLTRLATAKPTPRGGEVISEFPLPAAFLMAVRSYL